MWFFRILPLLILPFSVQAGAAVVEDVQVFQQGRDLRFEVTLRHGDTGWKHYADGWGVYSLEGAELGYRVLHHPHVNEQPFTRKLTVRVPRGMTQVEIRPRDLLHGVGAGVIVDLP